MPIYEFKCEKCGKIDEHLMRFSDPNPEACSKCGAAVHKIVSQTNFSLKGSGWYVTDYKKNNASESPETAGDAAPPTPKDSKTADAGPAGSKDSGTTSPTTPAAPSQAAPTPNKTSAKSDTGSGSAS